MELLKSIKNLFVPNRSMEFRVGEGLTPEQSATAHSVVRNTDPYTKDRPLSFSESQKIQKQKIASQVRAKQGKPINPLFIPSDEMSKEAIEALINPAMGAVGSLEKAGSNVAKPIFSGFKDLSTRILEDLKGRSVVSKRYISDLTNRGELKQTEREIVRNVLDSHPDVVDVNKFADDVKTELLPLKTTNMGSKHESMATLRDDIRGDVKNYYENVYESPVKTSAGSKHYSGGNRHNAETPEGYFGHTRVEDMADNKTRRVIEVQSDLYQKGNLERETDQWSVMKGDESVAKIGEKEVAKRLEGRKSEVAKLQKYNNPTAHFRMVREEIKKAAEDGKTKLQFPTGETAMKIERLSDQTHSWSPTYHGDPLPEHITPEDLKVGEQIYDQDKNWIVTEVIGDGKFKALPYDIYDTRASAWQKEGKGMQLKEFVDKYVDSRYVEEFDISGKVNTDNPIYKFYDKEISKYLQKFGANKIIDENGVSWLEIPITKEMADNPVLAFGKTTIGTLLGGSAASSLFMNPTEGSADPEIPKVKKPKILETRHRLINGVSVPIHKLENAGEIYEFHPKLKSPIEETYKKYPELRKGILEALLMKESSMGYDNSNKNDRNGAYGWLGGITPIGKKEMIRLGYVPELDTIEGVLDAMAFFWLAKDKDGEDPVETYHREYSSGKLNEKQLAQFKDMYDYYSSK